ncbi:Protocadherin-16 [Porites harrisoni]
MTIVQLTVTDENDNCPIFVEPSGNLRLDVVGIKPGSILTKVSATDLDNGVNGDISYSLSNNDTFSINSITGVIKVTSNPTREEYYLIVGAADKGEISCLTEIRLTVRVINSATTTPPTKPYRSSTQKSRTSSISSEVANTYSTSEVSSVKHTGDYSTSEVSSVKHTGSDTTPGSSTIPREAALVPQKGPKYVIIAVSASGGLLVLVIVALLLKKFVCNNSRPVAVRFSGSGRVNKSFQPDFEMSYFSRKI